MADEKAFSDVNGFRTILGLNATDEIRNIRVNDDGSLTVETSSTPYTIRMDDGATYLYIGKAAIGSSTASAVWQVQRITQADTTIIWADGNSNFDNIWDNFASLSFS